MTFTATIQSLEPGAEVTMYELDISTITNVQADRIYFHPGVNGVNAPVIWRGQAYQPYPIRAEGFESSTQGTLPRPRLQTSNVTGIITGLMRGKDDLIGAKLTRRRTFVKYLDAVNFPGGVNPSADPTQSFPEDVFYIQRKVRENRFEVEWELASPLDLEDVMLPARVVTATYCSWDYRSIEDGCPYIGNGYWDVTDKPVGSLAQDVCSKSVAACKLRFPGQPLPFGGFPAVKVYRG